MACCSPSKNHSTLAVTGQALPTHHGTTPQGPGPPSQGHHTPLQPSKGVLGPTIYCVNTFLSSPRILLAVLDCFVAE